MQSLKPKHLWAELQRRRVVSAALYYVVNVDALYWVASAHAVMGNDEQAVEMLVEAERRGWRHAWWVRHDWNWDSLRDDSRYRDVLVRGLLTGPEA